MSAASLLVRLGVDVGNVKPGVDSVIHQFDRLKTSVNTMGDRMLGAFPKTLGVEAKNIAGALGQVAGAFGGLGAIAGGAVVGAIGAMAANFVSTSSALVDLSAQTDITLRDLQRFQYAGDQVGVSMDSITGAVGQMQNRLGSLDKGALSGLTALGLTLKDIQQLNPGQQFEAIATRIAAIEDPSKRAALAMDLFGRSGVSLLPLLRSDLKAVGDQAAIVSDQTLRAADAFDDMAGRAANFVKAFAAERIFGPFVRGLEDTKAAVDSLGRAFDQLQGKVPNLPKLAAQPSTGLGGLELPKTMAIDEANKLADALTKQVEAQIKATEASRRLREAWVSDVKRMSDAITGAAVVTELRKWTDALKAPGAAAKVLADESLRRQLGDSIDTVTAKFGTLKAAGLSSLNPLAAAFKAMGETAETIPPKIIETMDAFSEVASETRNWAAENVKTTATLQEMVTTGQVFKDEWPEIFKRIRDGVVQTRVEVVTLSQAFSNAGDSVARIANAFADMLGSGGLADGIRNITTAWMQASRAAEDYAKAKESGDRLGQAAALAEGGLAVWSAAGAESRTSATLGAAAAGMKLGMAVAGPYGAAIGAAAGAIVGFVRSAGQGREAVIAFAESMGGFDTLHEQLGALGDEGERLWVSLTQGVGSNNPEQAKAAILSIQDALAKFKADPIGDAIAASGFQTRAQLEELAVTAQGVYERMRDSGEFTAASVQTAFERMQEAQMAAFGDTTGLDAIKKAVAALDAEYQSLFNSIKDEAPEEVMGIIETATRARMEAVQRQSHQAQQEEEAIAQRIRDDMGEVGIAARDAAGELKDAFGTLVIPPVRVPIEYDIPAFPLGGSIVALPGSNPEPPVFTPAMTSGGGGQTPVNLYLDGELVATNTTKHQGQMLRSRVKVGV